MYSQAARAMSTKPPEKTAQTEPVKGMVPNSDGGFVFEVGAMLLLDRFLIMGTESNTFYASAEESTLKVSEAIINEIKTNGPAVVQRVIEISRAGRAPKNRQAVYVLALAMTYGDDATKQLVRRGMPLVARTGSDLFQFVHYVNALRKWSMGLRKAIAGWYTSKTAQNLMYQIAKYPHRTAEKGESESKWSHKDLILKSHPKPVDATQSMIFKAVLTGEIPETLPLLYAADRLHKATTVEDAIKQIQANPDLMHELVPKQFGKDVKIWEALLPNINYGTLVRLLGRLTSYGVIAPLHPNLLTVLTTLSSTEKLKRSRTHPIAILFAVLAYQSGRSKVLTWEPVQRITDALNSAFYEAFAFAEPANKPILMCMDISKSMTGNYIVDRSDNNRETELSAAAAAAAMALAVAKLEKQHHFIGFSEDIINLQITPNMRLDDVMKYMYNLSFGGTDMGKAIMWALDRKIFVEAFVFYTDNEVNMGDIKPHEALLRYRKQINPQAKLICVGMTATNFTVADPADAGSLNIVGFDSAVPGLISDFIRGEFDHKQVQKPS